MHTLSGDIVRSGTMKHLMVRSVKETRLYAAEQTKTTFTRTQNLQSSKNKVNLRKIITVILSMKKNILWNQLQLVLS